nr:NADH-quinone oxidoreductase subunit M [Deinobacterium chartae]
MFIFLPLLAAALAALLPSLAAKRAVAVLGAALTLLLGVLIWAGGPLATTTLPWVPALGITYSVGLDGISTLLALVTALMTLLALLYAGWRVQNAGTLLALVLAMETGLIGIFAARDLILFYVFFEGTLLPALLMLAMYGGPRRSYALTKFAIYTIVGSLFMLLAIIGTRLASGAETFALEEILRRGVPAIAQPWLFLGFVAAFAVKLPIFPLHAWLPDFHEQNHPSGVPDVMGTLYKVGGYGLLRFALPLFPEAARDLQIPLMALAAFTAVYAAWIAFHQNHWKRVLAYAGLSHMGLVALGMFSLNAIATTGAMYLLAFQGIYTGVLFLAVGMLYARTGSLEVRRGGVMEDAPVLSGLTMTLWFATIGVPGLAGFIGEFSILLGAYQVSPWLSFLAGLSIIAAAAYALTAYQRTYWEERPQGAALLSDLSRLEWAILLPAVALTVLFGVYSAPALNLIEPGAQALGQLLGGRP